MGVWKGAAEGAARPWASPRKGLFALWLRWNAFLFQSSTAKVDSARPAPHPFGARGFASRPILLSCKIVTPSIKIRSALPENKNPLCVNRPEQSPFPRPEGTQLRRMNNLHQHAQPPPNKGSSLPPAKQESAILHKKTSGSPLPEVFCYTSAEINK